MPGTIRRPDESSTIDNNTTNNDDQEMADADADAGTDANVHNGSLNNIHNDSLYNRESRMGEGNGDEEVPFGEEAGDDESLEATAYNYGMSTAQRVKIVRFFFLSGFINTAFFLRLTVVCTFQDKIILSFRIFEFHIYYCRILIKAVSMKWRKEDITRNGLLDTVMIHNDLKVLY